MPMIHSLFGGSRGDDTLSFSPFSTRHALDGFSLHTPLLPTPRRDPRDARVRSEETARHHVFKADLQGVRVEDVRLRVEAGVVEVCGGVRSPRCRFRHRIVLPDDAEVGQVQAAVTKGVLVITVPRKETQKLE